MSFKTMFFDLDGTLYSNATGIWLDIKLRITRYLIDVMGFSFEEQAALRDHYFREYGTTLRGLQIHHDVNAEEFLAFVHNVPVDAYITPDQELGQFLVALPQKKWIFTNADDAHAGRVLNALGLRDCFDGIIDIHKLNFACKPLPQAYETALRMAGVDNPQECVFVDDMPRNLIPAKEMGFYTVLVNEDGQVDTDGVWDCCVKRIVDLRQTLPGLWQD